MKIDILLEETRKMDEYSIHQNRHDLRQQSREIAERQYGTEYTDEQVNEIMKGISLLTALQKLEWRISKTPDGYVMENHSPAGEHLEELFAVEDMDKLAKEIKTRAENFDENEHVIERLNLKKQSPDMVYGNARTIAQDAEHIAELYRNTAEVVTYSGRNPGKKNWCIRITETYRGYFYVKADTEDEAMEKFRSQIDIQDLDFDRVMEFIDSSTDIEEEDDDLLFSDDNKNEDFTSGDVVIG